MEDSKPFIFLTSESDPLILGLIKSRFNQEGYTYNILDEEISSIYHLPTLDARIFVHDDDFAEAKLVLSRIRKSINEEVVDGDYREYDHGDIEYERQIRENGLNIKTSNSRNIILVLFLIIIVFLLIILTL